MIGHASTRGCGWKYLQAGELWMPEEYETPWAMAVDVWELHRVGLFGDKLHA